MKKNKICVSLIVALVMLLSVVLVGCGETVIPLKILTQPELYFTDDINSTTRINSDKLPINTAKTKYMHLDFEIENIIDKDAVISMEIKIVGTQKLEALYKSGQEQKPPEGKPSTNANGDPIYTIPELTNTISSKTKMKISYIFAFTIADNVDKPINADIAVNFNVGKNVEGIKSRTFGIGYVIDKKIAQPSNIRIEGNNLVWDNVENNYGYKVKLEGSEDIVLNKDANKLDISGYTGKKIFYIQTLADGRYLQDSNIKKTNELNLKKLQTPKIKIDRNTDKIVWEAIEGATSYVVNVDGVVSEVTVPEFSINAISTGDTVVKVYAKSTVPGTFDSLVTNEVLIRKLYAPNITQTSSRVVWTKVDGATSYDVYINGKFDKKVTADGDLYYVKKPGMNVKVTVKACIDSENTYIFNSDMSNELVYNLA